MTGRSAKGTAVAPARQGADDDDPSAETDATPTVPRRRRASDATRPVERSLALLSAISQHQTGATLHELSELLAIPVASALRLLTVLEERRFVVRSATSKRYFMGPSALRLAETRSPAMGFLSSPHPKMHDLAHEMAETVFAVELRDGAAVCVALVPCERPLRLYVRMGQEMPLHAAASARVLLAGLDPEIASDMLGRAAMTAFSSRTPTTPAEVLAHLEEVRRRGFDVCDDELDQDVWAVSVPVRAADGRVCASLTLAAPRSRMPDSRQQMVIERVRAAGAAVSEDLGWVPA